MRVCPSCSPAAPRPWKSACNVLGIGGVAGLPVPVDGPPASDGDGAVGKDVPRVASELRKPPPDPKSIGGSPSLASDLNKPPLPADPGGGDAPSVASELRKPPPCGSAGMGGDCVDDHDGGSTPKVSGREAGGIGGGHEGIGAGKLLAGDGLNSGRFGGSHAIAPTRLAGICDQ